ncbi:hypothetical protein PV797_12020 [Clostridiaceae bacterium M8S5]|nr:hypothetical protein PV797_12020 [Clostridiaceae bacterium M8S5]
MCVLLFCMGVVIPFVNVPIMTTFHRLIPDEYAGRFWGIHNALSQGIIPLGLIIIGALSDIVTPATIVMFGGSVAIILGLCMKFVTILDEI